MNKFNCYCQKFEDHQFKKIYKENKEKGISNPMEKIPKAELILFPHEIASKCLSIFIEL